ncbi:MAG: allophycocyanin subunit beta, partial [Prochlorothrix sp.]
MQDAITAVIQASDERGQYLDDTAIQQLQSYFASGQQRVQAAATICANATTIVQEAVTQSMPAADTPQAGGMGSHRYAACIRDLDYFLRYATYAMVAGSPSILEERVLDGLKETYVALGVPIEATVQAIQAMKGVIFKVLGQEIG